LTLVAEAEAAVSWTGGSVWRRQGAVRPGRVEVESGASPNKEGDRARGLPSWGKIEQGRDIGGRHWPSPSV
jgi:hypothetical protein